MLLKKGTAFFSKGPAAVEGKGTGLGVSWNLEPGPAGAINSQKGPSR